MKYTIGEGMKTKVDRVGSLLAEANSILSEVTLELADQEDKYMEDQAYRDKVEEEYADWKTMQAEGVDRKGDN